MKGEDGNVFISSLGWGWRNKNVYNSGSTVEFLPLQSLSLPLGGTDGRCPRLLGHTSHQFNRPKEGGGGMLHAKAG